jgi:hypothetical protein
MDATDAIPLNCPRCGKPLKVLKPHDGYRTIYQCPLDGRFWMDENGRLCEERRSPDRPKSAQ